MDRATLEINRGLLLLTTLVGMILFYPLLQMPEIPVHGLETLATAALLASITFTARPT